MLTCFVYIMFICLPFKNPFRILNKGGIIIHCLRNMDGLPCNYLLLIHLETHSLMKLTWIGVDPNDDVEDDSQREI